MLNFRRIDTRDAADYAAMRNADDTWEWFFSKRRFAVEDVAIWISNLSPEKEQVYMVEEEGRIVGTCSIYNIDKERKSAEIGRIIVAIPFRRMGMGEIMVKEMINRGLSLGLDKFYANIMRENLASRRLFEKCGFRQTGEGIEGGVRYELQHENRPRGPHFPFR